MSIALLLALCLCPTAAEEEDTLSLGDRGEAVVRLQQRLMDLGFYTYKPTGSFQSVTEQAVRAYQSAAGLTVDGVVTAAVRGQLFSAAAVRKTFTANVPLAYTGQSSYFSTTGELIAWSEVKMQLTEGETYTLINCATGESCRMIYLGGENHGEMSPTNAYADRSMLNKWLGNVNSFYKIAVVTVIEGRRVASSLQWSGEKGCLYFYGSLSHVLNLPDAEHDALVQRAAGK